MAKGKKRPAELPEYGTVMMKGVQYYRTRITDADGRLRKALILALNDSAEAFVNRSSK